MSIKPHGAFKFTCDFPKCKNSTRHIGETIQEAIDMANISDSWVITFSNLNRDYLCFCYMHNDYPYYDKKFIEKFGIIKIENSYAKENKVKVELTEKEFCSKDIIHKTKYPENYKK